MVTLNYVKILINGMFSISIQYSVYYSSRVLSVLPMTLKIEYYILLKLKRNQIREYASILEHPGLTRVRSIWFLLVEIKRVLVYNITIFKLTDFLFYTFSFRAYMPTRKYLRKKG